jgi:hypothetical protein
MHGWFLIQTFYRGLKHTTCEHLDALASGAFFSLQVPAAKELIEKMVANQGWDGDRLQPRNRGVHQVDGIDMLSAKMDLLMNKLEAPSIMETAKIMNARMTCVVCGNVGHSRNDCPETREEANFINNGNNNGFSTTTTIKDGTQGPTSRSIIKMEVIILTISIISPPLEILSLSKLKLMKI